MKVVRTYKFKLYRSKKNRYLHQQIDIAGLIYNNCIALHRRYYRLFGKGINKFQLMKHLTKLKKLGRFSPDHHHTHEFFFDDARMYLAIHNTYQ